MIHLRNYLILLLLIQVPWLFAIDRSKVITIKRRSIHHGNNTSGKWIHNNGLPSICLEAPNSIIHNLFHFLLYKAVNSQCDVITIFRINNSLVCRQYLSTLWVRHRRDAPLLSTKF